MTEMELLKQIQLALTKRGCRAFRANVGQGWTGRAMTLSDGTVVIKGARRFSTGLPEGFPDLLVIAPGGRVVFMEVKTESGRVSAAQEHMHEFLTGFGQHVCVVRSVEDAINYMEEIKDV